MAGGVAYALGELAKTARSFGDIGEPALKRAALQAETDIAVSKLENIEIPRARREAESHAVALENAKTAGKAATLELKTRQEASDWGDEVANVGAMAETFATGLPPDSEVAKYPSVYAKMPKGKPLDGSQMAWWAEMMPKMAKVIGPNVEFVREVDEVTGKDKAFFKDVKTGEAVKNSRFYNPAIQMRMGGLIASMTDPVKMYQSAAAQGDPEAAKMLEWESKNPREFWQHMANRKRDLVGQMQSIGMTKEALEFAREGLKNTEEKEKFHMMTKEQQEEHAAKMEHFKLQKEQFGLQKDVIAQQLRQGNAAMVDTILKLKASSETLKLSATDQKEIELKMIRVKSIGDALTAFQKKDMVFDQGQVNKLVQDQKTLEREILDIVKRGKPYLSNEQYESIVRTLSAGGKNPVAEAMIGAGSTATTPGIAAPITPGLGPTVGSSKGATPPFTPEQEKGADLDRTPKYAPRSKDPIADLNRVMDVLSVQGEGSLSVADERAIIRSYVEKYPEKKEQIVLALGMKNMRSGEQKGKYVEQYLAEIVPAAWTSIKARWGKEMEKKWGGFEGFNKWAQSSPIALDPKMALRDDFISAYANKLVKLAKQAGKDLDITTALKMAAQSQATLREMGMGSIETLPISPGIATWVDKKMQDIAGATW